DQSSAERQARHRADDAAQPGDLASREANEDALLAQHADCVHERGDKTPYDTPPVVDLARPGTETDEDDADEGNGRTDCEPLGDAFTQEQSCTQGDEDRPDVDEHGRCTGV